MMLNERKVKEFSLRVADVLGDEKVLALSDRQDKTLVRSLNRLRNKGKYGPPIGPSIKT